MGELKKPSNFVTEFEGIINNPEFVHSLSSKNDLFLMAPETLSRHLIIGFIAGNKNSANRRAVIGLYRASDLRNNFVNSKLYKLYLISKDGEVQLGPQDAQEIDKVFQKIAQNTLYT